MKKTIALITGCLIGLSALTAGSTPNQFFQVRRVVDSLSGDTEEMILTKKNKAGFLKTPYYVEKVALLDETALESAVASSTAQGHPCVELRFTEEGRKRFAEIERQNVGKKLAYVVAGQLYSVVYVLTAAGSGETALIVGDFAEGGEKVLAERVTESIPKR